MTSPYKEHSVWSHLRRVAPVTSRDCDLAVVGAGLSGTAFLASLKMGGWKGTATLVEAGRGPGGRASSRRRRGDSTWCLDHGAPLLHWSPCGERDAGGEMLLQVLEQARAIELEPSADLWLGEHGPESGGQHDRFGAGAQRWRGRPSMDAVSRTLLSLAGDGVGACFGVRVHRLQYSSHGWQLLDASGGTVTRAGALVLSGNLLAHPRSLAMLGMNRCPLRDAVSEGVDPILDQTLAHIAKIQMEPRWNRMLECSSGGSEFWPRQIWLTPELASRWQLERLVLHPQTDGRLGVVVHGYGDAAPFNPEVLASMPSLAKVVATATDLGVMRWGGARPLDHPLPRAWQWNDHLRLGFCGDWIEGPGFASAQGAISSGVALAQQMLASDGSKAGGSRG